MIYFDNASTTKPYKECLDVFTKVSTDDFANASSNHSLGYKSSALLTKCRSQIAKYLKVNSDEIYFTSGATEGNNLAIKGVAYHNRGWADKIITTRGEHPSVTNVFKELEREGFEVVYLSLNSDGQISLEELKDALDDKTSLVSIMYINNETGYINPISDIYRLIKDNSHAVMHVDGTQAIGKIKLTSDYDLFTFSGHKIGGLKGSGALVKKRGVQIDPQILGGGQESGIRSGTSSLPLDCSLATSIRLSFSSLDERLADAKAINNYIREKLSEIDEIHVNSPLNASPFILNFSLLRHKGSIVAEALSNAGIYVSTTSACSSRESGESSVLKACGFDDRIVKNSIRLSFSGTENIGEADAFIARLKEILSSIKE